MDAAVVQENFAVRSVKTRRVTWDSPKGVTAPMVLAVIAMLQAGRRDASDFVGRSWIYLWSERWEKREFCWRVDLRAFPDPRKARGPL